ncbi:hypothetical protein ACQJBY_041030 [Aegilops geniculata]
MVTSIDWKPNPSVRPLNGNNSKEENGDAVSMQFDNCQFSYKELKTTSQIASRIPLAKRSVWSSLILATWKMETQLLLLLFGIWTHLLRVRWEQTNSGR